MDSLTVKSPVSYSSHAVCFWNFSDYLSLFWVLVSLFFQALLLQRPNGKTLTMTHHVIGGDNFLEDLW